MGKISDNSIEIARSGRGSPSIVKDLRSVESLRTEVGYLSLPRVIFDIIGFNGEPFTRDCLRALYPFAHEILVAEGAAPAAAELATPA